MVRPSDSQMAGQEIVTLPLPPEKVKPSGAVSASAPMQISTSATESAKNRLTIPSPPSCLAIA